jgi:subtilisin family serine protease
MKTAKFVPRNFMKRNPARWRHYAIAICLISVVTFAWADDDVDEELEQSMTAETEREDDDDAFERAERDVERSFEDQFEDAEELEDELEERLERMFEAKGHRGEDFDDEFITQGIEDNIHQLWQLEEMLDESGFPALPEQTIALLTEQELNDAEASGADIIATEVMTELGGILVTFGDSRVVPPKESDNNHLYGLDGATMPSSISTPVPTLAKMMGISAPISLPVKIGLMDSHIQEDHPCLTGVHINQAAYYPPEATNDDVHGTAMASILTGRADCAAPGILAQAELDNAVVFARTDHGLVVATAADLVAGLNWLLAQQVNVINLSLSGPPNRVLEEALNRVHDRGVIIVASAGNYGPVAFPRYPAAYSSVIAVTAIDAALNIYSRACQGDHIAFAAPGVGVRVADASTGRDQAMDGTSVAAVFVAAALALEQSEGADKVERMEVQAKDLGALGKDVIFGYGLPQVHLP